MYGGRISSIMLNIPGDEPAIMTTLDGHPITLQGRAEAALAISAIASYVGATFANVVLLVINLPLVGLFVRMRAVPSWILTPTATMVGLVGIYSISHNSFDILT